MSRDYRNEEHDLNNYSEEDVDGQHVYNT